jgi:hypothetical protein
MFIVAKKGCSGTPARRRWAIGLPEPTKSVRQVSWNEGGLIGYAILIYTRTCSCLLRSDEPGDTRR